MVAADGGCVVDVAYVEHGLGGEQEELAGEFLLVDAVEGHRAGGQALVQRFLDAGQDAVLELGDLVAYLSGLEGLGDAALDGLQVLDEELVVDDFLVAHGVDGAVDVGDVVVVEAAEHVDYGIGLADVGQELVAEALALGGTFDQAGDVDDFHRSGYD